MAQFSSSPANLSGQLLVAHPALADPNFRRRVILIAAHSPEDGALGVIVNWSLNRKLSEHDPSFAFGPLGEVPLYRGGPVARNELTFAAWNWQAEEGIFRLGFGLGPEQAGQLMETEGCEVRAFLGYAGWGRGQLEEEMAQHSWMVSDIDGGLIERATGQQLWREIIRGVSPEMRLFAEAPEDPSLN